MVSYWFVSLSFSTAKVQQFSDMYKHIDMLYSIYVHTYC